MAREFWSADCETDPFKHGRTPEPFIWGAYNGEDYFEFSTAGEFVQFFMHKDCVIYAHNGGKFDWHFILDWLEPGTKVSVINGRLSKFKIGNAEFRDSYNLFPFPLAEYKKDDIDYKILESDRRHAPSNWNTIRKYLRGDCVYLYDLLDQFFRSYGRKFTLPGAALSQWREISGEEPDHSNAKFYEDFAPYYYGGRVECFEKGSKNERFSVYDINSAYPFAMCSFHPWGLLACLDNRLPKGDDKISRAFITLECPSTGAFPFRGGNGLEFPSDNEWRTFHVTGWEYIAARDTGTLDARARIVKCWTFEDHIDFKAYVEHFYALKADAKKRGARGEELFAKYLLNGLYGKWASNPQRYSEYLTCNKDEVDAIHEINRCGACEACEAKSTPRPKCSKSYFFVVELRNVSIVARDLPDESKRFFNVAVGASITGFVRAHLWKSIRASGGVIYCDTDSIAVRDKGSLQIGDELGLWKSEGAFKSWAIAGKKLYAFEYEKPVTNKRTGEIETHKTASKGVKLSAKEIIAISKGAEIEYRQDAPTFGLRGGKKSDTKRLIKVT